MHWRKKDNCKTIKDVIRRNTGKDTFIENRHEIKDIDKVVQVIKNAAKDNKKITIVGDYDSDGVCASSIMTTIMRYLKINFSVRLPRRMSEGFGLSTKIVEEIETDILITVDNGIAAIDAVKYAKDKGFYVIVTDHHLANKDEQGNTIYPEADLIVNPNAVPNSCDFTSYCGAGIALKIAENIIEDSKLLNICKVYAALATIADVVPLQDENHLIVKEGLYIMNELRNELNPGLIEFLKAAGFTKDNKVNEVSIGYKLGPMINAPGRLWDKGAIESLKLLTSFNPNFAVEQAIKINNANELRKTKVEEAINLVSKQLQNKEIPSILFIKQENISEGIVGIIAGKLTELYERPCIVTTNVEGGLLKGSARTCNGIHLKNLLDQVQLDSNGEAFTKYGGHAEAAGLSLKETMFDKVNELLIKNTPIVNNPDKDVVYYDLEIQTEDIPDLLQEISKYAPFGNSNEQIVFKIKDYNLELNYNQELYSLFNENKGIRFQNKFAKAVSFNMADEFDKLGKPGKIDIIGTLSYNYYKQFVSNQIEIQDFKNSNTSSDKKNLLDDLIKNGTKTI